MKLIILLVSLAAFASSAPLDKDQDWAFDEGQVSANSLNAYDRQLYQKVSKTELLNERALASLVVLVRL